MTLFIAFSFAIALLHGVNGQLCTSTTYPTGTNVLQTASVYNLNDIYRISIDNITSSSSNLTILATSGIAKMATADNTQCPLSTCMMQLATNQRPTDLNILQQNNFLFGLAPLGYNLITPTTAMYCVTVAGNCGANVPLWRYYKLGAQGFMYAYSFNSTVTYSGYVQELLPVCYVWANSTVTPTSTDGISSSKMVTLATYVNAFTGANLDHFTTTYTSATNASAFTGYTFVRNVTKVAASLTTSTDALQCPELVKAIQMFDEQVGLFGTEQSPGLLSRIDHKIILDGQQNGKEANLLFENYKATGEYFYCVQTQGACGATIPLHKWFNGLNIDTVYTVTGDSNPTLVRDDGVLCYTWPLTYSA